MNKYRRIEVNAYRRRLTIVSGEWRPRDALDVQAAKSDDRVSLTDTDSCEPVEPDSPEGQLILVEAVRSLEQRLSPEGRALLCAGPDTFVPRSSNFKRFCSRLRSFFQPNELDLSRSENPAVKQSVKD